VTDLTSFRKYWNQAASRRIAAMEGKAPSRKWPLFGMLAFGLVAGAALGGYVAMSYRPQIKRFATYAGRMRHEMAGAGIGKPDVEPIAVVTAPRSNHRRKATAEV